MSDIVRLNIKSSGVKIKLKSEEDNDAEIAELQQQKQEDIFRRQLQAQYEKGYAEGQEETAREMEKEYSARLMEKTEEFSKILQSVERNLSEYEAAFDKVVIEVASVLAEKIIRREIDRESIITPVLRESLRRVLGADEIIIKLNPSDYAVITSPDQSLLLEETFSKIKFEADERIEKGGCYVETEIGNVDSRVSSQIGELKKQLDSIFKA